MKNESNGDSRLERQAYHILKCRASLITAVWLVLLFNGCSKKLFPPATPRQTMSFSGHTNGVIGSIVPVFASRMWNGKYATVIQQWLDAGTNGVVFTVTNQQSCDIIIRPLGRICEVGAHSPNQPAPVLNAPNLSGIRLKPGQVAQVEVALLPHDGPWRMQLSYTRTDDHKGFVEQLNRLITRKPVIIQSHIMESDRFEK